jgi:hypothetical protein
MLGLQAGHCCPSSKTPNLAQQCGQALGQEPDHAAMRGHFLPAILVQERPGKESKQVDGLRLSNLNICPCPRALNLAIHATLSGRSQGNKTCGGEADNLSSWNFATTLSLIVSSRHNHMKRRSLNNRSSPCSSASTANEEGADEAPAADAVYSVEAILAKRFRDVCP